MEDTAIDPFVQPNLPSAVEIVMPFSYVGTLQREVNTVLDNISYRLLDADNKEFDLDSKHYVLEVSWDEDADRANMRKKRKKKIRQFFDERWKKIT